LREITKRLIVGLENQIPDLQVRVDHVLAKQVFGVAITLLTSLLSRRTLYCSKYADGEHSVANSFDGPTGNIWFERTEHQWVGKIKAMRCAFCGVNESNFERGSALESHAYAFIHQEDPAIWLNERFRKMQFDIVIGNPPYQLNDGGGTGSSALPIYQKFVEQAQGLDPRFLIMVIPAKWYSGGKGLDSFRKKMLADRRIRYVADFPDSRDAFNGVDVAGGVCYFLWNRDHPGDARVETFIGRENYDAIREMDEFETFVRDSRAVKIIHKIQKSGDVSFSTVVSSRKPFGIEAAQDSDPKGDLLLYASGGDRRIKRSMVKSGEELIDKWKVLISKTSSEHAGQTDKSGTKRVLSRIEVMPPGSVCTESYLVVGPFSSKIKASHAVSFLQTKLARYLLSTILLTQNISKSMFEFVPLVDFSQMWSDEELYLRYKLTRAERDVIEDSIRAM